MFWRLLLVTVFVLPPLAGCIQEPNFAYEISDQCFFKGNPKYGAEITQISPSPSTVRIKYLRENAPNQEPHPIIVPRKITECRVFEKMIFGKTEMPSDAERHSGEKPPFDDVNYNGWFFLDLAGRQCWQFSEEKDYIATLDRFNVSAEDRVLRPTFEQDRSEWPNFSVAELMLCGFIRPERYM